ncbi:hypothetical protein [Streptomyces profundus]|uniref:hypothetical protein n=1 Tax=Streptomyces profundus TaxID=2867410 RepID=UPI001D15E50A|nr:hypothetical protein [Streptomyces sp. MA3_2.13]UED85723.1 hypothetical protein K4G22_17235 [Streptomyces sp. MA3_2.13]
MGIEDEKLVFDYLSRVGDLAHGTTMSAAERVRLVNRLRDEIGRERSGPGAESRASVKRILGRLGSPEDVVADAAGGGNAPPPAAKPAAPSSAPTASLPPQREAATPEAARPEAAGPEVPMGRTGSLPRVDSWRDGQIGGFTGGVDIPELLGPSGLPAPERGPSTEAELEAELEAAEAEAATADASLTQPVVEDENPPRPPRRGARLARAVLSGRRRGGVIELAGVAALVGGAVWPSLYAMALGWLLAYWSPRLSTREGQWAAVGMPALVATVYAVWLLGRAGGYWGELLQEGDAQTMLADDWALLLRTAALTSAAFLLFRARRPLRE